MFPMSHQSSIISCPYLEGGREGAFCSTAGERIAAIPDTSIRICLSRRFECCHIYHESLKKEVASFSTASLSLQPAR
jgi:hypothetical protein